MIFKHHLLTLGTALILSVSMNTPTLAGSSHQDHHHRNKANGIYADTGNAKMADFDIVHAKIETDRHEILFHMHISGKAGQTKPTATGKLAGSNVFSYVWPTKIDSGKVGFEKGQGILAMAITSHPDFDDTPLYDENGDGDTGNDGDIWHSHWVVLVPDDACGPGALKVKDIPEGNKPKLPETWPGLLLLIDSPGYEPMIGNQTVEVRVPFKNAQDLKGIAFDGITSGLRVSESAHSPLLCVVDVFDVASGDLSLPGKIK